MVMCIRIILLLPLLLTFLLLPTYGAVVVKVNIEGEINEGTVELIKSAFRKAEEVKADAMLIIIDTPGGLLISTKKIVSMILNSSIPVITYVYPPGAFSASAGSFILIAGHIAAMANGTSVGAATPVVIGEGRVENKTIEYIASYARSIAELRGRPADIIEKFVTQSLSLSAREAYEKGVIDVLADSPKELFQKIDGWTVNGKTLNLKDVEIISVKKSFKAELLNILTNPQVAAILLIIGIYSLIFGLMTPGIGMETLGAICIILSLFGLGAINVDYLGIVLILIGITLLVLELLTPTYGILGLASIICIALGSIILFKEPLMPKDFYRTFPMFIGGVILGIASIMTFIILKVAQLRKLEKKDSMINEIGKIIVFSGGEGLVKVRGEIWKCKSSEELNKGDTVVVVDREGLTLIVRKYDREGIKK
ncbi:MAG TPA: nodulation protein NfeD [Archaeoglobus profundus]|nr:nodulation protein NfeD [Archaeoglobus profundus]